MQIFKCKQFELEQSDDVFKITTDAMLLGSLAARGKEFLSLNILEIGTGSGIISLMLAQRFPNALITAIDINAQAIELASKNVAKSAFSKQIRLRTMDFMSISELFPTYDLIITNPPYFVNATVSQDSNSQLARHQSTFGYSDLINRSLNLLKANGIFAMICPFRYKEKIDLAIPTSWSIQRTLLAHHKNAKVRNMITEIGYSTEQIRISNEKIFYLRNEKGQYSEEYIEAMKEYLLIF